MEQDKTVAQGDGQAKVDHTFEALEKDFQEVDNKPTKYSCS